MAVKRLIEEAMRVIRTPTVSGMSNEELVGVLAALMSERGFKTELQPVTHSLEGIAKRQFNLIGILGDPLSDKKIKKGLLFTSALDTGTGGLPIQWRETGGDPLRATVVEERLVGLGAASPKVDFLCRFFAAQKFRNQKLKMPIYLVGTCCGEIEMLGAQYFIQSQILNPRYVLVSLPSGLRLVERHKSLKILTISIAYQMVHRDARGFNRRVILRSFCDGARTENAIVQMIDFLKLCSENGFDIQISNIAGGGRSPHTPRKAEVEFFLTSHQFEDFKRFFSEVVRENRLQDNLQLEIGGLGETGVSFLPEQFFHCVLSVAGIEAKLREIIEQRGRDERFDSPVGTVQLFQIFQERWRTTLRCDLRMLPETQNLDIHQILQQMSKELAGKFPLLDISISLERGSPALDVAGETEWKIHCKNAAKEVGFLQEAVAVSRCSEAGFFSQKGFDVLAFGPGSLSASIENESISFDELERAIRFYEKLIEGVCL